MSTKILITCPNGDVSVWTGFRAPAGTPLDGLKQVTLRKCPECGESHSWDADVAYWEDKLSPVSFWKSFRNKLCRTAQP